MELQVGKNYRIKNDIFSFKAGEVWSLVDEGYQAYFGEHNFVFVNAEKNCHFMVLRDTSDEDMEIGCHLDRYFEEIEEYNNNFIPLSLDKKDTMKILVIGIGVIGSIYGYVFSKAGHTVTHYLRKDSKKNNIHTLNVHILDGRGHKKGLSYTDSYSIEHATEKEYDFIFIAVPSGKLASVIEELNREHITGTLLIACGIWEDKNYLEKLLGNRPYVLGYPVAGGNLEGETLNACLFDHFMLESKAKTTIDNYDDLVKLFSDCHIALEHPYDMLEWIWLHLAINAGVISVASTTMENYSNNAQTTEAAEKLMQSAKLLKQAVKSVRETVKIVASRGVVLKHYNNELLPYKLPTFLSAPLMKRMFANNILTQKIMTLHNNLPDLLYVCKCVYEEGKKKGIEAPLFYKNCSKLPI